MAKKNTTKKSATKASAKVTTLKSAQPKSATKKSVKAKASARKTAARKTAAPKAATSKPTASKRSGSKIAAVKASVKQTPAIESSAKKSSATKNSTKRLSLAEVMKILEKNGSEQTRKTWTRHGATGPMFGVLFGELFKLMKQIDVDHELALQLWGTGNVDARNLAMKIADPMAMKPNELDQWAIENPLPMCGLYIATIAAEGPHARTKLREWLSSSNPKLRASGWTLLSRLSDLDESFPEDQLLENIKVLEKSIHAAPNAVKSEMNRALISIGGRSPELRKAVLAAAKRIGEVTIDHGDTSCKTPKIAEYVEKNWARSGAKFGSPAAHERSMKSMRRRC